MDIQSTPWSDKILSKLPQQPGFRFLDKITQVSDTDITGEYTFDPELSFYRAHFPGKPVTPGVILIESMAQTAVVAMGLYLLMREAETDPKLNTDEYLTMFTECQAEFLKEVLPGEKVKIRGEVVFWRRRKLRANAMLYLSNGDLAATASLSGMGVKKS